MRKGEIMKITEVLSGGMYVGNLGMYPAKSLRKLTPEEILHHAAPKIVTPKPDWDEMMIKRATEAEKRLSAIESRLNSLAPSHAELLVDVEALAEKMSAMQKEIDILEGERPEVCDRQPNAGSIRVSIQRGNDPARIFFDTCAFDCQIWAKKVLDSMREA